MDKKELNKYMIGKRIVPKYEDLWQELSELRSSADTIAPITSNTAPHPLCDDPFHVFAHYPSQQLKHDKRALVTPPLQRGAEKQKTTSVVIKYHQ